MNVNSNIKLGSVKQIEIKYEIDFKLSQITEKGPKKFYEINLKPGQN